MAPYEVVPNAAVTSPFSSAERVSTFLRAVYGWMCAGLGVTAILVRADGVVPAVVRGVTSSTPLRAGLTTLDQSAA